MNRERNKYKNKIGEILNATEFTSFVKSEAKRQYEDFNSLSFEDLSNDEKQEKYIEQYLHQLQINEWECIQQRSIK